MRKKSAIIFIPALISVLFMTAELAATEKHGTFIIGGKAWAALWDSAINRLQKKDIQKHSLWQSLFLPVYNSYSIKGPGIGIMGGPLIGYQTPDNKWNFSLAFMWFSYFETSAKNETYLFLPNLVPSADNNKTIKFKFDRREVDFKPSYSIDRYWKVFLGYKFQWSKIKGSSNVEMINHSIAPGAGFYYPLGQYFILGIQAIVLCIIPQQSKHRYSPFELMAKSADKVNLGITGEVTLATIIAEHLVIQIGYRAQIQWVDLIGSTIQMHTFDFFHGITLTVASSF